MKYSLLKQLYDKRILAEILQNRFCSFDESIVNWTYNDKKIKAIDLEKKLIRNYSNKVENKMFGNKIDYTDWLDIFDKSIKKLNSSNRQPILFFSGGKDSTFIASRMIKNKMKPLFYSYANNNNHKKIILDLAEKLDIKIHFTNQDLKYLNFEDVYKQIKEPVLDPAGLSILLLLDINFKNKINFNKNTSLEAQISAVSDDIAYNNHDIQDGIKANLFNLNDLIEINFFKEIYKSYKSNIKKKDKNILIYQIIRDSINLMVQDVIDNTLLNLKKNKIKKQKEILNNKNQMVVFSNNFKFIENEIKSFLRHKMYNNKNVLNKNNNGKKIIKKLFVEISKKPKKFINNFDQKNKYRSISDYISGMTDRFAIQLYRSL